MTRTLIIIFSFIVYFLDCANSTEEKQFQFKNFLTVMNNEQDTTSIRSPVPDAENPILVEIATEYNWEREQKDWQRNPFAPIETKVTIRNSTLQKKSIKNEAEGLIVNGIIQVNNTRKALINGNLYNIGSTLKNLTIIKIESNSVTLSSPYRTYTLFLKE